VQFNSLAFLIFLPVVYSVYWALPHRKQNQLLVGASYVFYGWWDWRFLGLILISSLVDFVSGRRIAASQTRRERRAWLAVSLIVNLGLLGTFKYLDFFILSAAQALAAFGLTPHIETLNILLPIGISFYTFQTLSYTIDIYRGQLDPTRDATAFFAFVAFFPQLVAGPIERASRLLIQFIRPRKFDASLAADGCRQMLYGLALKVLLADNVGLVADEVFADPNLDGWLCLRGVYCFAFQIYGDFAGYSHIAIGCASLFGFRLSRNFAYPYFSTSMTEFWRRWHISLSTWFRDYVYIPLGGNRKGEIRRRVNIVVTFALSGLWHGAAVTFPVWGILHGVWVSLEARRPDSSDQPPCGSGLFPNCNQALRIVATFHLVCLAWIFFRAPDLSSASAMIGSIAGIVTAPSLQECLNLFSHKAFFLIAVFTLAEWLRRDRLHPLESISRYRLVRWLTYATVAAAIVLVGEPREAPFIYFQF